MKYLYLSFLMRYEQSRENPTHRRYAVAKRENNARYQFPHRPVKRMNWPRISVSSRAGACILTHRRLSVWQMKDIAVQ
jgi:hypothetical protein